MNFQELLDAQRTGQLAGLPEDWGQGRTLFGGMMAALLLDAMRQQVPADGGREVEALFIKPGFGRNPLREVLWQDLATAKDVEPSRSVVLWLRT